MKIWFPTIRAGTGVDVYTTLLANGLRQHGIDVVITWLPHLIEIVPHLLRCVKPPPGTDIIHTNSWYGFVFANQSIPLCVSAHHWVHEPRLTPYKSILQRLYHQHLIKQYETQTLQQADAIVAVSRYTAGQLAAALPLNNKPLHVIHNGIDIDSFTPAPNKHNSNFRLLYVGSHIRRKGFDLLASIMARLPEEIVLYCTGGAVFNNADRIIGLGKLDLPALIQQYRACDALIFPTRCEGFGYVVAEAMACGKPVVASNCTSIPEIIVDGESGLLCPVDDVACFAESVLRLANDQSLCSLLGKQARATVLQNFTIESMVADYLKLYRDMVS